MLLKKMVEKIWHILDIIKIYKNWPIYFIDRLGVFKNRKVIYQLRSGIKHKTITGNGAISVINEFYREKTYLKFIDVIEENSVVIDIGAHIGVVSVFLAKKLKSLVYSYEPVPSSFSLLKENIRLNNLESKIIPFELGVLDRKGRKEIFTNKDNASINSFHPSFRKDCSDKIIVDCIALKDIFDSNNIERCDFLKLDCEGVEYKILNNLPEDYYSRIKNILMEYHFPEESFKIKENLKNLNFDIEMTSPGSDGSGIIFAKNKKYNI